MTPELQLIELLEKTFEDRHLDTDEKAVLFEQFQPLEQKQRAFVRNRAFDMVKAAQKHEPVIPLLKWLQAIIKSLDSSRPTASESDTYFSPGDTCLNALLSAIKHTKKTLDICVFTIADNTIRDAILEAHSRNIHIRIITDNDKTEDMGSDIETMARAGVKTRTDDTRHHMHHKFAIFDNTTLLTGSFNWTRSASLYNHENLILLDDKEAVTAYIKEFDKLWGQFAPFKT